MLNKKNILIIIYLLLFLRVVGSAQVVINEIFFTNGQADLITPSYNYLNWIELYNKDTTQSVRISGYYLSDDSTLLRKWAIPNTTIQKGKFLIIYADGENTGFHTNFRPSAEGGILWLSNYSGNIIDRFEYPRQAYNISYGRKPDGANSFYFFSNTTRLASNNAQVLVGQALPPVLNVKGGFYNEYVTISFSNSPSDGTIYYTTDGSEPTEYNKKYTGPFELLNTTVLRARTFAPGKAPSYIVTETYFINHRKVNLPVISLATDHMNLYDNRIGIHVVGINGIEGNCYGRANWNRDWERAANFEFFDTQKLQQLNQLIGIKIAGACSRTFNQKSFSIHARSKYGKGRFKYQFFADRYYNNFNSLMLRNGGNDFHYTLFRDALFQKLTDRGMDLDHQSFQPVILYINSKYWGIMALYERSGPDLIEAKYGLSEDQIDLVDLWGNLIAGSNKDYFNLINYVQNRSLTNSTHYQYVADRIDIDNYIDYLIFQIFIGNHDWPGNNVKIWKKQGNNQKFRWIVYDTDFGFGLYSSVNDNTITLVFDSTQAQGWPNPLYSTVLARRLIENPQFKNKFISRFITHVNSTFKPDLVIRTIDSIQNLYISEIRYHCSRWSFDYNYWLNNVENLRNAARQRPQIILNYLYEWFKLSNPVELKYSNKGNIRGRIAIDNVISIDTSFQGNYPINSVLKISFIPPTGYTFKQAIRKNKISKILHSGENWKYWDSGPGIPYNWYHENFDDSGWKEGPSQLGYGDGDEKTIVSYGNDPNNKFITTYFRKSFVYDTSLQLKDIILRILYDDGAVVYINGTEVLKLNFPTDVIDYNTLAYNAPDEANFFEYLISTNYFKHGLNTIAVEIHQTTPNSSDISFDLELISNGVLKERTILQQTFIDTLTSPVEYIAEYQTIPNYSKPLIINEVAYYNSNFPDEFGEYNSWIEIYNKSNDTINLSNFFYTDSVSKPDKYKISRWYANMVNIAPQKYALLWLDKEPWQGPTHLPFDLSANFFAIIAKRGNQYYVVDSINLNKKFYGPYTIAKYPNISGKWYYPSIPTALLPNKKFIPTNIENNSSVSEKFPVQIYYDANRRIIYVTSDNMKPMKIFLINMEGKIMQTSYSQSSNAVLSLQNNAKGFYIVKVLQEDKIYAQKIIFY